ncbi:flocculation protein FLO11-like [Cyprinodon tularosa]|uniref:flocculation protein FLO11-like n=1 Tax=Cyprinodon tularosa TaxID=77115 RepID=UPI0018E21BCE|nr:flocculation protein FLO11-like [Cyprinodon tularosa]
MLLFLVLLLVGCSEATHFLGTMMTYYPAETLSNGSISVILRYKLNFVSCIDFDIWQCSGNCGTENQTLTLTKVEEISGEWCQREGAITHRLPNNTGFQTVLAGGNWINNIQNSVVSWRAVTNVELRTRSDIGKPNTSPQTTILPALRIPSNCPKIIDLLAFDPDGDEVKCRYGNTTESECNPCNPPSVLILSSTCSLNFTANNSPSSSSDVPYAVQLVMEDFPTQNINLTQNDGSQEMKTTSDAISKIPLQFVLKVAPAIPSCTEGLYLPRFIFPTPNHRDQLHASVGQALEIHISAVATASTIANLRYSGPYNVVKNSLGSGNFTLTWTPSASEEGQSHAICFTVQANVSSSLYDSELRCVIVTVAHTPTPTTTPTQTNTITPVTTAANRTITTTANITNTTTPTTTPSTAHIAPTSLPAPNTTTPLTNTAFFTTENTTTTPMASTPNITFFTTENTTTTRMASTQAATTSDPGPEYIIALNMKISTTLSLENDEDTIISLIKNKLVEEGLPSSITVRLLSGNQLVVTTASP